MVAQHNYSNTNLNSAATVAQVVSLTRREQRKLKTKLHRRHKKQTRTELHMVEAREVSTIGTFVYMILCRTLMIAEGQPLKAFLESGNKTIVLPSGNRCLAERMRKTQLLNCCSKLQLKTRGNGTRIDEENLCDLIERGGGMVSTFPRDLGLLWSIDPADSLKDPTRKGKNEYSWHMIVNGIASENYVMSCQDASWTRLLYHEQRSQFHARRATYKAESHLPKHERTFKAVPRFGEQRYYLVGALHRVRTTYLKTSNEHRTGGPFSLNKEEIVEQLTL